MRVQSWGLASTSRPVCASPSTTGGGCVVSEAAKRCLRFALSSLVSAVHTRCPCGSSSPCSAGASARLKTLSGGRRPPPSSFSSHSACFDEEEISGRNANAAAGGRGERGSANRLDAAHLRRRRAPAAHRRPPHPDHRHPVRFKHSFIPDYHQNNRKKKTQLPPWRIWTNSH